MSSLFQLAWGSVLGRDHAHDGKNNQDAYCILEDSQTLIAVICDGCGESVHSEVGATIGSRFVAQTLQRSIKRLDSEEVTFQIQQPDFWERVRLDVVAQLRVLCLSMGESLSEVVTSNFLFTIVGAVVTKETSLFFSLGDGTLIVNGEPYPLGPYPNNSPPYLGYGLVGTTQEYEEKALSFQIALVIPTDQVKSFLIGTDGVDDYIASEEKNLPGKQELVGPIEQLWRDDRFFNNKVALTRRLNLLNSESRVPDWNRRVLERHPGILHDDTTIVVGRRRQDEEV